MKQTKTVDNAVRTLWAKLATAAAERALAKVKLCDDPAAAERWAGVAANWLDKAGARATEWSFRQP